MISNQDLNVSFFADNKRYQQTTQSWDSYRYISQEISRLIGKAQCILDMGNGGFINYHIPPAVRSITAVDICILNNQTKLFGKTKVNFKNGDILNYHDPQKYDLVIMQNFLHHVVGETTKGNYQNLDLCLRKTFSLLSKGGRLLIMESVVPAWLEKLEKLLYQPAKFLIPFLFKHPVTFQYSRETITNSLLRLSPDIKVKYIKPGKYYLIYGLKVPTAIAPVRVANFNLKRQ